MDNKLKVEKMLEGIWNPDDQLLLRSTKEGDVLFSNPKHLLTLINNKTAHCFKYAESDETIDKCLSSLNKYVQSEPLEFYGARRFELYSRLVIVYALGDKVLRQPDSTEITQAMAETVDALNKIQR